MRCFAPFATLIFVAVATAQSSGDLLTLATRAFDDGKHAEALQLVNKAIATDPKKSQAYSLCAEIHEGLEKYTDAVADWSKVLDLDGTNASAYQLRGLVQFKAGKIKESIADFDQYIERAPKAKISHWQRGISYYYAGQYDDGRRQFEGYQDFDSNDVENAVWRFMCMVRVDGIDKARKAILKIGEDKRVPMRQVYDLYKGELNIDGVMKAAKSSRELFYAHLYVGIYYDLLNDKAKAFDHLNKATEEHRIGHYMWDVARIHRDLLAQELKKNK